MVTHAKMEVEKTNKIHRLANQLDQLDFQRQKERENDLAERRRIARLEADNINKKTLKQHEKEKSHFLDIKARYGRQGNSYAPDSLRMAAFGGQIAAHERSGSTGGKLRPMQAHQMPTATGLTKANPERLTTIR